MPTANGKLGVGICGVGWCGAQHIQAFQKNPHTDVTWLYGGPDEQRTRASAAKNNVDLPNARIATSYEDLIAAPDVDIVSIASPCTPIRPWPPPAPASTSCSKNRPA